MRVYENGTYRDMAPEELQIFKNQSHLAIIAENSRPLTQEEVFRMFITQQINTLQVDDHTALRMKAYYPEWITGVSYEAGFKVRRNNKLWRALQAHTSQDAWEPENAAALWEIINETHDGTLEDPIPYAGNMRLTQGKYYIQDNVIYLCTRDTGNPVYHPLADLIGLYVEAS